MSDVLPLASRTDDLVAALIARLAPLLDAAAILTDPADCAARAADATPPAGVPPRAVLRPATTEQVALILREASALGQPIVVQGGRTGLSGGARARDGEVAMSLERLRRLSPADPVTRSLTAGAGVTLAAVQEAARAAGLSFPVDLGARGTATIGGLIATNAGGIRVLRHGMMRAQVAGLEAVLPDGTILRRMSGLTKDNTGPDLTQALIGSEGIFGIITEARLHLSAAPASQSAALIAVEDLAAAVRLLTFLRGRIEDLIAAFEVIYPEVYAGAVDCSGAAAPLPKGLPLYILTDIQGPAPGPDEERFQAALEAATEEGLLLDAVLAETGREQAGLWALREAASEYIFTQDHVTGHDIGLPLDRITGFMDWAPGAIAALDPEARLLVFGHLGDGNLHFIVQTRQAARITPLVLHEVIRLGGAISAEHGLGQDKASWLAQARSAEEMALLRRLKQAFDPAGILNPGRVFAPADL